MPTTHDVRRMLLLAVFLAVPSAIPSRVFAAPVRDDFSTGGKAWVSSPAGAWSFHTTAPSALRVDLTEDGHAWITNAPLGPSWRITTRFSFLKLYRDNGDSGVLGIAASSGNLRPAPSLLADVSYHASGQVLIAIGWYDGTWHEVLNSGWLRGGAPMGTISLERLEGESALTVSLICTNSFQFSGTSDPIPANRLNDLSTAGLRANQVLGHIAMYRVESPAPEVDDAAASVVAMADDAIADLLRNFWRGDAVTGQIANTWYGDTNDLPDSRGGLWERATLYQTLFDAWILTGDIGLRSRLAADWYRTKSLYSASELEACGQDSGTNWASDDAGWSALMYLLAFRVTADQDALARAEGIVRCAFTRWFDDELGGGLWYSDARTAKSLYQVSLVLSALWIHDATHDRTFLELALKSYSWMESHLLRSDGLYWTDFGPDGPWGKERPDDIGEAGSVVFLGGSMAMAAVHARLHRLTGEEVYRRRALRTAEAIRIRLVTPAGVYLNDRDAWVNGTFSGEWVRELLTMRGVAISHAEVLRRTGASIYNAARTSTGFYGGSWSGPADGPDSRWFAIGSKPQQIMTSANSVHMIVAAALAASHSSPRGAQLGMRRNGQGLELTASASAGWWYGILASDELQGWQTWTNVLMGRRLKAFAIGAETSGGQFFNAKSHAEQ